MIYLTAIGLPPGGSSTVHIYTQTIHRTQFTKMLKKYICNGFNLDAICILPVNNQYFCQIYSSTF